MRPARRVLSLLVVLLAAPTLALSPAAARNLRNAQMALSNVQRNEAWGNSPVPAGEVQSALRLHKEIEETLNRASNAIRAAAGEKDDPEFQAVYAQWEGLRNYFVALTDNINAGNSAAKGNEGRLRAFRDAVKGPMKNAAVNFAQMLEDDSSVANGYGDAGQLKAAMDALAQLDGLCKGEYAGLQDIPNTSFQLDTYPTKWCAAAAARDRLGARISRASINTTLGLYISDIEKDTQQLASHDGFSNLMGFMYGAVHETKPTFAKLREMYAPQFKAAGQEMPEDLLAPLQKAVDGWWAEARRLAPQWKFPTGLYPTGGLEARMKKGLGASLPKYTFLKLGMLKSDWLVTKNALGIPLDRYRTGMVLYKHPDFPLCVEREWTVKDTWVGGGKWSPTDSVVMGSIRLETCP